MLYALVLEVENNKQKLSIAFCGSICSEGTEKKQQGYKQFQLIFTQTFSYASAIWIE